MHVFKSKIDKGILICLALSVIACLMGASVMIKVGGTGNYIMAAAVVLLGAGFPLWLLMSTRYIVKGDDIDIISGPFSWHIPIDSITALHKTQSAMTSPALSFDRLEIAYGNGKAILVSPLDQSAFIEKLGKDKLVVPGRNKEKRSARKVSRVNAMTRKKKRTLAPSDTERKE